MAKRGDKLTTLKTMKRTFMGLEHVLKIEVAKDGTFQIKLPKEVADALREEVLRGSTLESVERQLEKVRERFREARTTHSDVIFYQFKGSGQITAPPGRDNLCNVLWEDDEISFTHGLAISVVATLADEEVYHLLDGKKIYNYHWKESRIPGSLSPYNGKFMFSGHLGLKARPDNVLDWTPEREAFFMTLGNAMEDIVLKLDKLKDRKALDAAVRNQALLGDGNEPAVEQGAEHLPAGRADSYG